MSCPEHVLGGMQLSGTLPYVTRPSYAGASNKHLGKNLVRSQLSRGFRAIKQEISCKKPA